MRERARTLRDLDAAALPPPRGLRPAPSCVPARPAPRRHAARDTRASTRRSRRQAGTPVIATLIPCPAGRCNDVNQMRSAIEAVRSTGTAVAEVALCYTADLSDPGERLYTLDYYLRLAEQIVSAGAHVLAIKDMAGLLRPRRPPRWSPRCGNASTCRPPAHPRHGGGQLATLLAAWQAGRTPSTARSPPWPARLRGAGNNGARKLRHALSRSGAWSGEPGPDRFSYAAAASASKSTSGSSGSNAAGRSFRTSVAYMPNRLMWSVM